MSENLESGRKSDRGKPAMHLLLPGPIREVAEVLEFGARKYDENNWKIVPNGRSRYLAAGLRHIFQWMGGEQLDEESGFNHLAHGMCCLMFLLYWDQQGEGHAGPKTLKNATVGELQQELWRRDDDLARTKPQSNGLEEAEPAVVSEVPDPVDDEGYSGAKLGPGFASRPELVPLKTADGDSQPTGGSRSVRDSHQLGYVSPNGSNGSLNIKA